MDWKEFRNCSLCRIFFRNLTLNQIWVVSALLNNNLVLLYLLGSIWNSIVENTSAALLSRWFFSVRNLGSNMLVNNTACRSNSPHIFVSIKIIILLVNEQFLSVLANVSLAWDVFERVWGAKKVTSNLRKHGNGMRCQWKSGKLRIWHILGCNGLVVRNRFTLLNCILKQITLVFALFGPLCG